MISPLLLPFSSKSVSRISLMLLTPVLDIRLELKFFYFTRTADKVMEERKECSEMSSPPSSPSPAPGSSLSFLPHTWQQRLCAFSLPRDFPLFLLGFKLSLNSMASPPLGSWDRASSLCYFFFIYFCANKLHIPPRKN